MLGKRETYDNVEVEHLCQGQHVACESMCIKSLTHLGSTAGETDALLQGWTLPHDVLCGASLNHVFFFCDCNAITFERSTNGDHNIHISHRCGLTSSRTDWLSDFSNLHN